MCLGRHFKILKIEAFQIGQLKGVLRNQPEW
jgi:hypothetical protein